MLWILPKLVDHAAAAIITEETRHVASRCTLVPQVGSLPQSAVEAEGYSHFECPLSAPSGAEIPVLQGRDSGLGATRVRGVRNAGLRPPLMLLRHSAARTISVFGTVIALGSPKGMTRGLR